MFKVFLVLDFYFNLVKVMGMDLEKKQCYNECMQCKKEVVDVGIECVQEECGIVLVIIGNGKGKFIFVFGIFY